MPFNSKMTEYGLISESFSRSRLGEICVKFGVQTGPFGSQLHQEDYVEIGTPIITVEHLGDNRILHQNLPKVSDKDHQRLSKYQLKTGDIVFSRVGSVDRRALVQTQENGWLFSGRCLRVRVNPELIDSTWLSYFFGLPAFKEYIRGIAVGATMPSLNTKILSEIPIYFPKYSEQRAVADILAAIDENISINRQATITLEKIAQSLFKSWFIDFDPVKAKMAGRQPEAMDEATTTLFPAEFEESTVGLIPKGWQVKRIDELMELVYGKALKAINRLPGNVPVYGSGGVTGFHNEHLVFGPSVIVGRKGTVGSLYWEDRPFFPIDTVFYVKPKAAPLTFCYELLKTKGLSHMNTDAAVPGLNRENVYRLESAVPPATILAAFDEVVSSIRKMVFANIQEAQRLTEIRDTLLPNLISGKLRISAADEILVEGMFYEN